jgi:hypothetical protein
MMLDGEMEGMAHARLLVSPSGLSLCGISFVVIALRFMLLLL